ncbi:MAG: UvrD-helicase domain-containing protein [Tissierellia bacterium]|nr:UvrD-helicase domain-containing protein [Tissierellia bacterium]
MLKNLNDRQLEAVTKTEGPMLILAGAGSGKTKVLTTKIAYLIDELGVDSGNILAITFTNKAAKEMKDRVQILLDRPVDSMWIGTFHSICVRILRRNAGKIGYDNNFTIYDRADQLTLLKEVYKEMELSDKVIKPSTAISKISKAKNEAVKPEEYTEIYGNDFLELKVEEIYSLYEEKKKDNNSFDFDDLIVKAIELLNKDEDTLKYYQNKFRYVFVDEYQDTNRTQYELVRLFSGQHGNICVVGDGDQSIYGWRGADINNILDFEKDFNGADLVLLEENYRSTSEILNAANKVIKKNSKRKDKNLWTSREGGKKPIYKEVSSEDGEARAIVEWIDHLVYNGENLSEMAILYRTNAQSRQFEEALVYAQIPYMVVGGLRFYDRKEIKDILAYLRIIVNPKDDISLKRIINEPKRGIGAASIEKLEQAAASEWISIMEFIEKEPDFLSGRAGKGVLEFKNIIDKSQDFLSENRLSDAVKKIIETSGMIDELKRENTIESKSRLENIESFISAIGSYESQNPGDGLDDYLASVSLMSDVDKTDESKGGVNLMTIHAAKGLEYKTIFLTGVEEGIFPSKFSMEEDNVEEERRLFYVAITRAKDNLYLTSTTLRRHFGSLMPSIKSRFIDELEDSIEFEEEILRNTYSGSDVKKQFDGFKTIDREKERNYLKYDIEARRKNLKRVSKDDFKMGDKVKHKIFGIGTIINVKDADNGSLELMISFEKKGLKKLRSDLAPIERL